MSSTRDTGGEITEANALSIDRLTDFVATVSAKDPQLGDWLQRALAAFMAGEELPRLKRSRQERPSEKIEGIPPDT